MLGQPHDICLLRARALIYKCKGILGIHSREGNNSALALANLKKALVRSNGRSEVTALEMGDAVHAAAWRYETDLSSGPDDTPFLSLEEARLSVLRAVGTDLAESADYRQRAGKWAQVVLQQAVDRCRPRSLLQESLLELVALRMRQHLDLPPDSTSSNGVFSVSGSLAMLSKEEKRKCSLVRALRGLAPADAARVWGFLESLRQVRCCSNVVLVEAAWRCCHVQLLQCLAPPRKRHVQKRHVLHPLHDALEHLPLPKQAASLHELLSEAAGVCEFHVPSYLSSAAVARLAGKSIMSGQLQVFDALSCEEDLDEEELQQGLVSALVDDDVLFSLADHAATLR
jgi:hypothetical protein